MICKYREIKHTMFFKQIQTITRQSHHMLNVSKIARDSVKSNKNVKQIYWYFLKYVFGIQPVHLNSNLRYQEARRTGAIYTRCLIR